MSNQAKAYLINHPELLALCAQQVPGGPAERMSAKVVELHRQLAVVRAELGATLEELATLKAQEVVAVFTLPPEGQPDAEETEAEPAVLGEWIEAGKAKGTDESADEG